MQTVESNKRRPELIAFLQTVARPGFNPEKISDTANLFDEGLVDSLAFVEIILFLEQSYGIRLDGSSIDPASLSSVTGLLQLIDDETK